MLHTALAILRLKISLSFRQSLGLDLELVGEISLAQARKIAFRGIGKFNRTQVLPLQGNRNGTLCLNDFSCDNFRQDRYVCVLIA